MIINRIWRVVPRLRKVLPHLKFLYSFEFCCLLMSQQRSMIHTFMLSILIVFFLFIFCSLLLWMILFNDFLICFPYFIVGDPFVISTIQWFIMNVILVTALPLRFCSVVVCVKRIHIKKRKIKRLLQIKDSLDFWLKEAYLLIICNQVFWPYTILLRSPCRLPHNMKNPAPLHTFDGIFSLFLHRVLYQRELF